MHTFEAAQPKWFVAYTYPNSEKKADQKLGEMGINSYLPLHEEVRQWSDRKKKVQVPLFPNYIFVHISPTKRINALKPRELLRFVSFGGKPAIVQDKEIENVKKLLSGDLDITNELFLHKGMKVKITKGQFAGIVGILIRRNGKKRLVIQIEALRQAISVDITADCAVPI